MTVNSVVVQKAAVSRTYSAKSYLLFDTLLHFRARVLCVEHIILSSSLSFQAPDLFMLKIITNSSPGLQLFRRISMHKKWPSGLSAFFYHGKAKLSFNRRKGIPFVKQKEIQATNCARGLPSTFKRSSWSLVRRWVLNYPDMYAW